MKEVKKILCLTLICIFLSGCNDEKKLNIIDNLNFEINSDLNLSTLINPEEDIKVVNPEQKIDTSVLGDKEVVVKYYKGKKEKYYSFQINIVDTTPPTIEAPDKITIIKGKETDLLANVKIKDNSNEEIKATIEGEYDINKIGDYHLKYIAIDSSENKTEKDLVVTVKNVTVKTTGYYVLKKSDVWVGVHFYTNGKVDVMYNYCPGYGCGGYSEHGTYKITDEKVTLSLTYSYSEDGKQTFPTQNIQFTINSENLITHTSGKYNWAKSFS